ncbi:MAG: hypothetical protein LIO42_00325 [Oscillospiraceae bacterium]|nr:hypothetical protein [Oscillospiraceae bacterium]
MSENWTEQSLWEQVERYFDSITRLRPLTEGGEPVYNRLGETVETVEYLLPPTENDLCLYLGVSPAQWRSYGLPGSPLRTVTERARERILAWCVREMLTRPGKDLKGLEMYMARLDCSEHREPEQGEPLSLEEKLQRVDQMLEQSSENLGRDSGDRQGR